MNINSFSLFGDKRSIWAYGISTNLRIHHTLYPSWKFYVYIDGELDDTGYEGVIKELSKKKLLTLIEMPKNENAINKRLKCTMMLWRMLPIWDPEVDFVFCRDLDSILTPRQFQCVSNFINSGKNVHGINDNISHNIPLMGGMIGFKTKEFLSIIENKTLNELIQNKYTDDAWETQGTDQFFLMNSLWPQVRENALIHKLTGPNDRRNLKDLFITDFSHVSKEVISHGDEFTHYIGAAGTITDNHKYTMKEISEFYNEHGNKEICNEISNIEKTFKVDLNITH